MSQAVKIYKHFQTPKASGVYHRLICLTGEKKGNAYFILDKKRVVLGRSETADIKVVDLKSSREHAEIIQVGDDFILTDLGSQNGIVVNDLKVKQHVLSDGDKIIIGKTVYKFSKIEVKQKVEAVEEVEEELSEEQIDEKKRDQQLARFLLGIIFVAIVLFAIPDSQENVLVQKSDEKVKVNTSLYDADVGSAIERRNNLNDENQEKVQRYIHRGLREYREGNYFRSYAEFDNAAQWDPKNPRVRFYLRKTKEKQNEIISSFFSKGSRDMDALNFKAAQTAYCTIVRLLIYHFPKDERITQARDNLRIIEEKTGEEKNSIKCTRKEV
ncbi:MAG: hypothetical protein CME62_16115 [Halobacteriovoraceae bacterium]|nr:hypothetical protein [Halobacteriovoraceae bacterium]|tara:strand:- start:24900 stop:25880 length:981 start_codon:yes stop_codon:yes gene_type:complete